MDINDSNVMKVKIEYSKLLVSIQFYQIILFRKMKMLLEVVETLFLTSVMINANLKIINYGTYIYYYDIRSGNLSLVYLMI